MTRIESRTRMTTKLDPDSHSEARVSHRAAVPLILASSSPRRRELLESAQVAFEIVRPDVDETILEGERPEALAERLAREKALAVARDLDRPERHQVLGSDTIVVLDEAILGKPDDADHAVALLQRLTGRRHRVITGIAVVDSRSLETRSRTVESSVRMRSVDEATIRAYVATGEPLDKAGAYALQGEAGARFVESVEGSRSNVIGLPVEETLELLRESLELASGAASATAEHAS